MDLEIEINNLCKDNVAGMKAQAMYFMAPTGNVINDLSKFTKVQGGGKSDDVNDKLAVGAGLPSYPDSDGRTYHTVNDIIWSTFKTVIPDATPYQFYNMSETDRAKVIEWFFNKSATTGNNAVDAFLFYMNWGGWGASNRSAQYLACFKNSVAVDAAKLPKLTFLRLISMQWYFVKDEKHWIGWRFGILNFYKLFKNYI